MKLIAEHIEQDLSYTISEGKDGRKNMFLEGIFMQANMKNRNNRIYGRDILESAVDRYVNEQVHTGRAVGELNHPEGPTINLDKVSHRITELRWDGDNVMGKAMILNTPMGQIVKGLLEGGVKLGVSSRGMGTVGNRNGVGYVNKDYVLATVDVVQDPSASQAYVNGILENREWILDESTGSWVTKDAFNNAVKAHRRKVIDDKKLIEQFEQFINSLGNKTF